MKIAFFTEAGYTGKVQRNNPNIGRSDMAWVCLFDAVHYPLNQIHTVTEQYDLGIAILPKKKKPFLGVNVVEDMKRVCSLVTVMQESNYYLWQDDDIEDQIWYLNNLTEVDFMFVHNDIDKQYYSGLLNKPCEKLPTVIVTDHVQKSDEKVDAVMLGGNCVSIYRGIDSYMIARELELPIYALSSGRMKKNEGILGINHLPWIPWVNFMTELSKFKYAVQIGTGAAGSFNLNCAYLGVPCIGLKNLETQNVCFPDLSLDEVDMKKGKELILRLQNDTDFYEHCVKQGQENYKKHFAPEVFAQKVNDIYEKYKK